MIGDIIWIIIVGTVVGLLARLVVPGRQPIPMWLTVLIGIVGALVGNWLASLLGVRSTGGIDWIRHILQVAVAAGGVAATVGVLGRRGSSGT
jgi:uncharacterized membrane protein YeaQ/YmgE (transglycosylase-associated protein family)